MLNVIYKHKVYIILCIIKPIKRDYSAVHTPDYENMLIPTDKDIGYGPPVVGVSAAKGGSREVFSLILQCFGGESSPFFS